MTSPYYKLSAPEMAEKIERLEASNAELLEVLGHLVEIDRRDEKGDPDMLATERWRHEARAAAYAIVERLGKAQP